MLVDLHLHSSASDGQYTPDQVVRRASERRMDLIALTDHDSVDGVSQAMAAARQTGIALIPGVELSCDGDREVHLLGYGLDADAPEWRVFFSELQRERRERARRIAGRLAELGHVINFDEVLRTAAHSVSRSHIALALMASGAVSSVKEAFQRFLGPGAAAYLPRPELPMAQAIGRLRGAGAVPVLAHPGLLPMRSEDVERCVRGWREQGLMGLEAHYPRHTPAQAAAFERLARKLDMLVTGGSDAHGETIRPIRIGEGMDWWARRGQDALALWRMVPYKTGELEGTR